MRAFRRNKHGSLSARFSAEERSVLASLAGQVAGLLASRDSAAGDPALTRLLPYAYRGDVDAAAEFRRFTEDSLAGNKIQNAAVVAESLERARAHSDAGSVDALLRLYHRARFSDHDVTDDDIRTARTAVIKLAATWRGFDTAMRHTT